MSIVDFQIHKLTDTHAIGYFVTKERCPSKDDECYWHATGEVEFGGGYQETGSWDTNGYKRDLDLWFQRNNEKTMSLKEGVEYSVGHCLRVKTTDPKNENVTYLRHSSYRIFDFFNKKV